MSENEFPTNHQELLEWAIAARYNLEKEFGCLEETAPHLLEWVVKYCADYNLVVPEIEGPWEGESLGQWISRWNEG